MRAMPMANEKLYHVAKKGRHRAARLPLALEHLRMGSL